jgi:lipoprotein-anchoring transpeptidase ErfK/SrfK
MKLFFCALALSTVFFGMPASAATTVVAKVDLSQQRMNVYVGGVVRYTWAVSTGRGRYRTPTGTWSAKWLSPKHRSRKYHNAPMPWSVFYNGGYAVHGTTDIKRLGAPASHGCIRLHPDHARTFFKLVQANGMKNTRVQVTN